MTEKEHCESVADDIIRHHPDDSNSGKWRARVADLLMRERAVLLAKFDEAVAEGARRIDAIAIERDNLLARAEAAEAVVAEMNRALPDAKASRRVFDEATRMLAEGLHVLCVHPRWAADIVAAFVTLVARAEKADVARFAAQMALAAETDKRVRASERGARGGGSGADAGGAASRAVGVCTPHGDRTAPQ